jgi:hypothetical protein
MGSVAVENMLNGYNRKPAETCSLSGLCRGGQIRTDDLGAQAPRDTVIAILLSDKNLAAPRDLIIFSIFTASLLVPYLEYQTTLHGIPFFIEVVSQALCSWSRFSKS